MKTYQTPRGPFTEHYIGSVEYSIFHWKSDDGYMSSAFSIRDGRFYFQQKLVPDEARILAAMLIQFADEFEAREAALAKEYAEKMKEAA